MTCKEHYHTTVYYIDIVGLK